MTQDGPHRTQSRKQSLTYARLPLLLPFDIAKLRYIEKPSAVLAAIV
jgi:hypothetical protein